MNSLTLLVLAVSLYLGHRALLGLRLLIEPPCPRCGGRRWARGESSGWSCVACNALIEQHVELDRAA
ncbi:hypothetical protein BH23GEM3_BH23GEM3_22970 [soil metagenome]|nr:hypothetical protein [Gemmatimonadota bacterium]